MWLYKSRSWLAKTNSSSWTSWMHMCYNNDYTVLSTCLHDLWVVPFKLSVPIARKIVTTLVLSPKFANTCLRGKRNWVGSTWYVFRGEDRLVVIGQIKVRGKSGKREENRKLGEKRSWPTDRKHRWIGYSIYINFLTQWLMTRKKWL